jgi:hypothetical protein
MEIPIVPKGLILRHFVFAVSTADGPDVVWYPNAVKYYVR